MTRLFQIDGMYEPPPYVKERVFVHFGGNGFELAPVRAREVWKEAFPNNAVDWNSGWRALWKCAAVRFATGTDYVEGHAGVEVQAIFADGRQSSSGIQLDFPLSELELLEEKVAAWLIKACGSGGDTRSGLIGVYFGPNDPLSRPCLTITSRGRNGGAEAAYHMRQMLVRHGIERGITVRAVRDGGIGVVKVQFLPEHYLEAAPMSFGIDWSLWCKLAPNSPESEWSKACLIWCDAVVDAFMRAKQVLGDEVEDVFFDQMRVVPIFSKFTAVDLISGKHSIVNLLKISPCNFLFNSSSSPSQGGASEPQAMRPSIYLSRVTRAMSSRRFQRLSPDNQDAFLRCLWKKWGQIKGREQ